MDIATIVRGVAPLLKRNSSTILTGLGVAGSVGSAILAVKATPRATFKLDSAFVEKNADHEEGWVDVPLTKREVIKLVWKDYIPALGLEIITIGAIIGAQSINMRRNAALISVISIGEAAAREYQERMAAEAPAKDRKVRDDIARETIEKDPVSTREVIMVGNGDQLFYDKYTGRYFKSTKQLVDKAVNDINFRILNQEYASLNEFYIAIGLAPIDSGEEVGWTPESPVELDYSTQMSDQDEPAIVISFLRKPLGNYWKGFQ